MLCLLITLVPREYPQLSLTQYWPKYFVLLANCFIVLRETKPEGIANTELQSFRKLVYASFRKLVYADTVAPMNVTIV